MAPRRGRRRHNRYEHQKRYEQLARHDSIPARRRKTTHKVNIDGQPPPPAGLATNFAL
jgi:hypothetical protein